MIVIFTHHYGDPDIMKSKRDKSNDEIFSIFMDKVQEFY